MGPDYRSSLDVSLSQEELFIPRSTKFQSVNETYACELIGGVLCMILK